jgi:hypothetical protein
MGSFAARYPGRCAACDERIHEGDQVKYADDELLHTVCDVPSLPNERDDLTAVCRQCWTIHKGECL